MALEEEFDTEIPDEEAEKITTFRLPLITSTATGVSEHLRRSFDRLSFIF